MRKISKDNKKWEYGNFQTPTELAIRAVHHLRSHDKGFEPMTIIEPTCGVGGFLLASADLYPNAKLVIGVEIEPSYLEQLQSIVEKRSDKKRFRLINGNFFQIDWENILKDVPKPVLIVGNPPWVTNSDIGKINGNNIPEKINFQNHRGLEAITGKSNFDISEYMLMQNIIWLENQTGYLAVLCKTAVARKILKHIWQGSLNLVACRMIQINAFSYFKASVDACFFIVKVDSGQTSINCDYYESFESRQPNKTFGYHQGLTLANVAKFNNSKNLLGLDKSYTWRSGIKHDCSKVMELKIEESGLKNGLGEIVDIEDDFIFPLLKSSDFGNHNTSKARLNVVVTQAKPGDATDIIQEIAPDTWKYLTRHGELLDNRASSIYRNKPRFSIFGIGPYSFSSWKVAISGFYKKLSFQVVGPIEGKSVMVDDTVYFLSCSGEDEAYFLADILNSEDSIDFFDSMIFWSDKRPITIDLLKRLHIGKLAKYMGRSQEYNLFASGKSSLKSSLKPTLLVGS